MKKILSLIVILLLLLVNFNLLKSSYESQQKLTEINKDEEKLKELESENQNLEQQLKNRNSDFFVEQEARNRLGLGKPGETAIVIEDSSFGENNPTEQVQKTNLQKWLDLVSL